jgi:predicted O-methyltransferase YrrM
MDLINESLQHYAEQHTSSETDLLKKIDRDTHAKVMMPRMLSGHLQGRVLSMISHMIRPQRILEIGTYTGYSAVCMAEGLQERGKLITIDINEELEDRVRDYFASSSYSDKIEYKIGNAAEVIPGLNETFDLVFIDADKERYSVYFDLIIDKVRTGGFILADNVLWSGKVLDAKPDKDTRAILEFNKKIQDDPRVENVLLPIRDGIMLMRKVSL